MTEMPKIVETLSFQDIFSEKLQRFTTAYQKIESAFERPTAADPAYHILAELSFSEIVGRERINQAAYAQLLRFSNDLEFLLEGHIREGENYEAFRERMRNRLNLASPAGSTAMYKALTFLYGEASIAKDQKTFSGSVTDVFVDSVQGDLIIYVLMGIDDPDLKLVILANLKDSFQKETVTPALDKVSFLEAKSTPFTISGTILLKPGFGVAYKADIEKNFRAKFQAEKRLGWGPSTSWIVKELHQDGVQSVTLRSPGTDISVIPSKYAAIASLDLTVEAAK